MNSTRSISRKFFVAVFAITTFSIALLAIVSIFVKYDHSKKDCELLTETYIKEQNLIVKYEVERAVSDIEFRIRNSNHCLDTFQDEILELLKDARFPYLENDMGIFFVKSYDGIQKLSVTKPELTGTNVSQFKGPDGVLIHKLFMDIVNESEFGFVEYLWVNPATGKAQKKRSFIKGIPELQWYIGAGYWLDDLNSVLEEKKINLKTNVRNYVFVLIIIVLISYLTIFAVTRKISKRISDNFEKFSLFDLVRLCVFFAIVLPDFFTFGIIDHGC